MITQVLGSSDRGHECKAIRGRRQREYIAAPNVFCLTHGDVWSTDTLLSSLPEPSPLRLSGVGFSSPFSLGEGSGQGGMGGAGCRPDVWRPLWTGEKPWYLSEVASVPGCNAVRRSPLPGLMTRYQRGWCR